MSALLRQKKIDQSGIGKSAAALTAALVKRDLRPSAKILGLPIRMAPPASAPRTLPRLHAILRTPDTRLFISVSSAAFTFILGYLG